MWVSRTAFREYCYRKGANSLEIIGDLSATKVDAHGHDRKVIVNKLTKKKLGAFTNYAKAQTNCFVVDMAHPDVAGVVDLKVAAANDPASTTPAKGGLKSV